MDIRQLRYFVGVLEAKSLTKASALLHVAQPALGMQIRNLERELGVELVRRHPRGVTATEAGTRLLRRAEHLLQEFDLVRQGLIDDRTSPNGRVLLRVGRGLPRIVAATIAERCRRMFPDIQLSVVVGGRKQLYPVANAAEPELVLTFRPRDDLHLVSESLIQDELYLVCSAKETGVPHEIDFRKLTDRLLILPREPHYLRRLVDSIAQRIGRELKVYCDVDSLDTTAELVKRGLANTILPLGWVREDVRDGKFQIAKITDPMLQRTLFMLHSSSHSQSSTLNLIRREAREVILTFAHDQSFGWKTIS